MVRIPLCSCVRQDHLESRVIEGLQREVLHEDAVRYALAKFKMEMKERLDSTRSHMTVLREERERLKSEIDNLAGSYLRRAPLTGPSFTTRKTRAASPRNQR
jgi:hypothetical protein